MESVGMKRNKIGSFHIPLQSATLPIIQSDQEEAFIMRYIHGGSWLYMTLKTPGEIPKTWDNGEEVRFLNFKSNNPNNNATKMCVYINGQEDNGQNVNHGLWINTECDRGQEGSGRDAEMVFQDGPF